jgi:hypothetical protein
MTPYVETALASFSKWLSSRNSGYEQFNPRKTGFTSNDMQEIVKDWMVKMTALRGETLSKELEGSNLPVYIVDCPKLHVIPKKWLELKLRWSDKWAYEVSMSFFLECGASKQRHSVILSSTKLVICVKSWTIKFLGSWNLLLEGISHF